MKTLARKQIEALLPSLDLLPAIEEAFARYSAGEAVVPPVGELLLPGGDVHIKYGLMKGDPYYVVKIASGFYGNPARGLPSSNGMMLLFRQETGEPAAVLLDEGRLTDVRTAVAGAIAAKYLAPKDLRRIGIIGTGTQARLQLEYLQQVTDCRDAAVWGRNESALTTYSDDMERAGFTMAVMGDVEDLLEACQLIVTTTPATSPLITTYMRAGTHLTCVGSDTAEKQEVAADVVGQSDVIVADSIVQCLERGEIHHAVRDGRVERGGLVELGDVVAGRVPGRTSADQVTVADLTGVAVQDIAIATAVFEAAERGEG